MIQTNHILLDYSTRKPQKPEVHAALTQLSVRLMEILRATATDPTKRAMVCDHIA